MPVDRQTYLHVHGERQKADREQGTKIEKERKSKISNGCYFSMDMYIKAE